MGHWTHPLLARLLVNAPTRPPSLHWVHLLPLGLQFCPLPLSPSLCLFFFFFFFSISFYLFLAALGLCYCTRAFSSCGEQALIVVLGLLVVLASLVAEHRL